MTVISTANDPKLLWPGLNKIWGLNCKDPPKYYRSVRHFLVGYEL